MCYHPDPPFQIYWPEEPAPVFRADPTAPMYYADAPVRDFFPDDAVDDSREAVMDTAIRTMPVFGPVSQPANSPRTTSRPQASTSQGFKKPSLSLVPPVTPGAMSRHNAVTSLTGLDVIDRRVTLIEIEHLLDMFLEADESDGYTRAELTKEIEAVERKMKLAGKRVRGNLLHRVAEWMRSDKS